MQRWQRGGAALETRSTRALRAMRPFLGLPQTHRQRNSKADPVFACLALHCMTLTLQQIEERKEHLRQEILERECLLATLEVLRKHVAASGGSKTIDLATLFPGWLPEREAASPARQVTLPNAGAHSSASSRAGSNPAGADLKRSEVDRLTPSSRQTHVPPLRGDLRAVARHPLRLASVSRHRAARPGIKIGSMGANIGRLPRRNTAAPPDWQPWRR